MNIYVKNIAVLSLVGFVSACAAFDYDLAEVEGRKLSGNVFKDNLHKEYLMLAREEDKEDDWEDAKFFAGRSTMAAAGEDFGPQEISDRSIPDDTRKEIGFARSRLVNALVTEKDGPNAPHVARAQASFDCWLQEQEENTQPEDIAKCRTDYKNAMASIVTKKEPAPAPAPVVQPAPEPAPKKVMKPLPVTFVVYFDHDSVALNDMARVSIANAVAKAGASNPRLIRVGGHADTTGNAAYNNALSDRRAAVVAKMLAAGGLNGGDLVKTSVYGEGSPAVDTGDNVNNRGNRRVEITLWY